MKLDRERHAVEGEKGRKWVGKEERKARTESTMEQGESKQEEES